MGPVPQLCPAGVTQPRPRGTPCTRLLATSQRSACRALPAQGRGTGTGSVGPVPRAGRPLTRLAAAPQLSMLRISPSMGHPLDLSLALRHLLFLLEYCMVTGYDWWDILLHVQPAMVQSLVDRLHEEYTRQTAALQQVGRPGSARAARRGVGSGQPTPTSSAHGQRDAGRGPSREGSLAGAPQGAWREPLREGGPGCAASGHRARLPMPQDQVPAALTPGPPCPPQGVQQHSCSPHCDTHRGPRHGHGPRGQGHPGATVP